MQKTIDVPIVSPPRVYILRVWFPATAVLGLVIANSAGNRAMQNKNSGRHTICGSTIPGLPRAPRYIPMEKNKCDVHYCSGVSGRSGVEASGGICRNWTFERKVTLRHQALGLESFLTMGSICCALIFLLSMDR